MGDSASGALGGADQRRKRPRSTGSAVLTPPGGLPVFPDLAAAGAERADIIRCCRKAVRDEIDPCVCGHGRTAHEHYRPGWDCGTCGAVTCCDYRSADGGRVRRALRRFGLVT